MNILHLEDELTLQEIIRAAFLAADPSITIKQFTNSDDAWQYIEENPDEIDLYILDVRIPGSINGIVFAEKLRERMATGTIIINSAYGKPTIEWLEQYNAHWFEKPQYIIDAPRHFLPLARKREYVSPVKLYICENCNHDNKADTKFCTECGTELTPRTRTFSREQLPNIKPLQRHGSMLFQSGFYLELNFREESIKIPLLVAQKLILGRSVARMHGTQHLLQEHSGTNTREGLRMVITPSNHFLDLTPYGGTKYGCSRRHAAIHQAGSLLTIEDLDSTNGSWLNGTKLQPFDKHLLRDGDELLLGNFAIEVRFRKHPKV